MRSGPVGDAERARFLLRQRHHVHAPAQRDQHGGAERDRAEQRQEVGRRWWRRGCRAARTSSPEAGCRDRRGISRGRRRRRAATPITTPVSTSTRIGSRECSSVPISIDRGDRDEPAGKGQRLDADDAEREDRCRAPRPSAAPDEAPRISGDTSGLRNSPWNAVPATASAAPTSTAATTRGPRTSSTTFSTAGGAALDGCPVSRDHSTSSSSREADRIAPDRERNDKPGREHGERDQKSGPG